MAKTWVLQTETKGTGAQVVPIDSVTKRASAVDPVFVLRQTEAKAKSPDPEPRRPHRFKLVDVMTRQTLAEDASARATVDILQGVRSIVDVDVYVWQDETSRWRRLTFAEQRALMDLAAAGPASRG